MPTFGGGSKCGVCGKTVYFNEERKAAGKSFHVSCFRCSSCGKSLDSTTCNSHEDKLFCKACYGKAFGPKGYGFASGGAGLSANDSSGIPGTVSGSASSSQTPAAPAAPASGAGATSSKPSTIVSTDPERCPRCGKKVYLAEQILGIGRKWHRPCFRCADCGKSCDSTNAADHDGELYCKSCHGKNFGTKGFGFGIGAGALQMS